MLTLLTAAGRTLTRTHTSYPYVYNMISAIKCIISCVCIYIYIDTLYIQTRETHCNNSSTTRHGVKLWTALHPRYCRSRRSSIRACAHSHTQHTQLPSHPGHDVPTISVFSLSWRRRKVNYFAICIRRGVLRINSRWCRCRRRSKEDVQPRPRVYTHRVIVGDNKSAMP